MLVHILKVVQKTVTQIGKSTHAVCYSILEQLEHISMCKFMRLELDAIEAFMSRGIARAMIENWVHRGLCGRNHPKEWRGLKGPRHTIELIDALESQL